MRTFKLRKLKRVHGLHFAPDGGRLLAVGGDEAFMVDAAVWLDLTTGAETGRLEFLADQYAVAPGLSRLALGGGHQYEGPVGHPVRWADPRPDGGAPWHPFPVRSRSPLGIDVFGLAFAPDGNRLAVGHGSPFRRTADLGEYEWEFRVSVRQLDPPKALWQTVVSDMPGALAFSPDGTQLAVTGGPEADPPVHLFTPPGRKSLRFDPTGTRTRCLAFSPNGTRLAAANARAVYLLSTADLSLDAELAGHKGQVNAVAFSPDGRRLLSASHDGAVRVWDVGGGRLIQAFDWKVGPVTALAVAPDGLTCTAAGKGGQVVIWDLDG